MKTINNNQPINLKVVKFELNFVPPPQDKPIFHKSKFKIQLPAINIRRKSQVPAPPITKIVSEKPNVHHLMNSLLEDLYSGSCYTTGSTCAPSMSSSQSVCEENSNAIEIHYLESLDTSELAEQIEELRNKICCTGERLGRCVRARDRFRRQQKRVCDAFSVILRHITGESSARFSITPSAGEDTGEGGYTEWLHAMRLVARLPAGVPQHFRKKLWLTLAERYLNSRDLDWPAAERACFRGTALPDDGELGAQILKDLHRTGCSLFCGTEGRENQAMLRRVLLAYARWNKEVGYCQGFNMLAAIILEVMEKSESESLKVMIYLVEAVLPEGYFADDLRGLSADMAAFRDLLKLRLPRLASHMDHLQKMSDGGGVEPPLPDVFTMQWFLTLYATWIPRESLLRIWDFVLLDGNEVLLLTALAIWDMLQDRILSARSADEYYSCMGGGAGAIWEAGDALVGRVVALGSAPELPRLRNLHRYRITPAIAPAAVTQPPLHSTMQTMTKKGLRLFYSEDEGDSSDDGNKMALATIIPRRDERLGAGDRLSLDIGALKRQYARLRERQRQAHVILAAACARHAAVGVPTSPTSLTVNSLLLGRSAIVSTRGRRLGPPPGSIPPSRQTSTKENKTDIQTNDRPDETINWMDEKHKKTLYRRNSLKWKDVKRDKTKKCRKASIEIDETGDGIILSETEANEMIASIRSRSASESSTYSSHSSTSTDTSLCDDRLSDSETDLPVELNEKQSKIQKTKKETTHKKKSTEIIDTEINSVEQSDEDLLNINDTFSARETHLNSVCDKKLSNIEPLSTLEYVSEVTNPEFKNEFGSQEVCNFKSVNTEIYLKNIPTSPKSDIGSVLIKTITPLAPCRSPNSSVIDLSPIQVSPYKIHSYDDVLYDFDVNLRQPSISTYRPPDIIDSFTKYPNFVPDIDLSEKSASDFDSPARSPGGESIVVSEDEPPIPLQIDKYFEDSPEFFGARITITDPNNGDIPTRRSTKRFIKTPRKPDSLTLQLSHNKDFLSYKDDEERASSLPQSFSSHSDIQSTDKNENISNVRNLSAKGTAYQLTPEFTEKDEEFIWKEYETKTEQKFEHFGCQEISKQMSPKDIGNISGRNNSERALQIIQENSKILSRILTKQNISEPKISNRASEYRNVLQEATKLYSKINTETPFQKTSDSPLLKESTSDSLIGYSKNIRSSNDKNDFLRNRPISLDDPLCLNFETNKYIKETVTKYAKSPSSDSLINKTDRYGWENKGFIAKSEYQQFSETDDNDIAKTHPEILIVKPTGDIKSTVDSFKGYDSNTNESKREETLSATELKDTSLFERNITSVDNYSYSLSTRYNDFVLTKASDICSKTTGLIPKVCENLYKSDNSKVSDFTHAVTSSISFTYEPSVDDDSPMGVSNSSDTLCQITSLDQVSTPISPKIFPRETPTLPKEFTDKSDRVKLESDDTCSAITSILESDTSSFSYPKSPSTGSYHPFPRPPIRMPKELGIRLGMYPKDPMKSPSK